MGKFYRIIFLFALIPIFAPAQTLDCEQTLALPTEEYNAGHFYNVSSILNECLPKFNRDQRQRAFLLLTQTYLLLDDPIGAQRSYLEVLSANPEFVPDEQLHAIDIVYLSKRFTATPKFSWFVGAGSNVSTVSMIRDLDAANDESMSYKLRPGYNLGLGGEYSYDDNIRVRMEVNFLQTGYAVEDIDFLENDHRTFVDRQTWFNVPVHIGYSDNMGTYRPYAYAGYSISKLFTDKASIVLDKVTNVSEGESETFQKPSSDYDFKNRRSPFHHSLIFGAGLKYKIGLDFVFVEARYSAGLKNFINEPSSLANSSLEVRPSDDDYVTRTSVEYVESITPLMAYGHRDNHFRLNNIAITFGFVRPLYKPRELKRVRTRSVLRKMKRSK